MDRTIIDEVLSGIYLKHVPIRQGDTVVDVGAHIGAFALSVAPIAERVYAFEPHPENYAMLLQNMADNVSFNVFPYNLAITDSQGDAMLELNGLNTGGHFLSNTTGIPVKTAPLDSIVRYADFLKVDAEGSEVKILNGARHLLQNNVRISMEVHSKQLLEQCASILHSLGYTTVSESYGVLQYMLWAWKQ